MNKKFLMLFCFMFLLLPISVKAENKIYFASNQVKAIPGVTYDMDIKVNSDGSFKAVDFDVITTSEDIDFVNVTINKEFTNSSDTSYSLTSDKLQASGTRVATLTYRVSEDIKLGTTGVIKIVDSNLTSDKKYELPVNQLKVVVNSNKSNDLLRLSSTIAPFEFDKEKTSYKVKLTEDVSTFDLVAVPEDSEAKVEMSSQKLKERTSIISIKVKREGLPDKIYTVTVIKPNNNKEKIEKNPEADKALAKQIRKKWIPIITFLSMMLLIDLFFIKGKK